MKTSTAKSIPIQDAIDWTQKWQENYPEHAKAFLIPVDDLIACMTEMGIVKDNGDGTKTITEVPGAGIRAYMGVDGSLKNTNEKLVLVGTVEEDGTYRDIVEGEKAIDGSILIGSGAYDLTTPCPNECDELSPLFHK